MEKTMGILELQKNVKAMDRSTLVELRRMIGIELETRGETISFQTPDTGALLGQGIYTIGEHIPAGTFSFYLPKYTGRASSGSARLSIFENLEKYQESLERKNSSLTVFPAFSIYRNAPVSCVKLTPGQILVIRHNGVIINRFALKI